MRRPAAVSCRTKRKHPGSATLPGAMPSARTSRFWRRLVAEILPAFRMTPRSGATFDTFDRSANPALDLRRESNHPQEVAGVGGGVARQARWRRRRGRDLEHRFTGDVDDSPRSVLAETSSRRSEVRKKPPAGERGRSSGGGPSKRCGG